MDKDKTNRYVQMLDEGQWERVARSLVNDGLSNDEISDFVDSINWYPDNEFWQAVNTRRAEHKALEDLNDIL